MYDDDQALGAELRRLAEADPLGPTSAGDLLVRGRRGRRRRQLLSATAVAALVAAVPVTAATLPELDGARDQAVAGEKTVVSTAPSPSTAPTSSAAPAPGTKPTLAGPTSLRPTDRAGRSMRAAPDAGTAEILRACSVKLTALQEARSGQKPGREVLPVTDLTGWTVLVRAIQPKVGTSFVAFSPDRKVKANCVIYAPGVPAGMDSASDTGAWPAPSLGPKALSPHLLAAGTSCAAGLDCSGFLYTGTYHVPAKVVRIRATATNGRVLNLRPRDGWLAVMWADGVGGQRAEFGLKYRAYDARGKEIKPDPDLYREVRKGLRQTTKGQPR